jgi:UPF0755 protein
VNNRQSILDILMTILKYVVLMLCIMVVISFAKRFYNIGYSIFAQSALAEEGTGKEAEIEVTENMSVRQIANQLKKNELIGDAELFRLQEQFSGYHGEIRPGTYTLSSEMTPDEMLAVMSGNAEP